jgi:homoserine acetyltransferase
MKGAALGLPVGCVLVDVGDLELECGGVLRGAKLAASLYGSLNSARDNAIVVGHSLTSDSRVHTWWASLMPKVRTLTSDRGASGQDSLQDGDARERCLDPSRHFIVCFNYLGSCYGSTSSLDFGGFGAFPSPVTMRDQARAALKGLEALGVKGVAMAIGGSMGAMLALELGLEAPRGFVRSVCCIAGCAQQR